MCGIAGCIVKSGTVSKELFEKMVDIVKHRGPNARGSWYEGNVAIGHRRLSIIDLSDDGCQPLLYKDRYVLSYNGEIYNYLELKAELKSKGYSFKTETDTEVLAAMYDCYKEDCLHRLNGMWAFILYDRQNKTIFCARDRFGIKPFYYWCDDNKFLIASEIKQILLMLDSEVYANVPKLKEFLVCGDLDFSEETMFEGIKQLSGGTKLVFDVTNFQLGVKQYYDLSKVKEQKISYENACIQFQKKFERAVKLRMRADVNIGYCLSGGLDSSAIVCMADRMTENVQYAISSCFEDERYDEQEYIDEVIANTQVKSCKIFPEEKKLFEELDKVIWHMDEPFGSTSIFAQWNVFQEAGRKNLQVMLDGQGADEQLAGYTGYYSVLFAWCLKKGKLFKFIREWNYYKKFRVETKTEISPWSILASALAGVLIPDCVMRGLKKKFFYPHFDLPFSKEMIVKIQEARNLCPVNNEKKYILDSMKCGMASLLHYEDRDSMAHSIESRIPFLDYEFVEFIYSLPFNYKLKDGMTKAVLRKALEGILPEKVRLRRSKLGFVTPEDQWINNNYKEFRRELLEACERLEGVVEKDRVMEWFDQKEGKLKRNNFVVWRIICAGRWMNIFNVKLKMY